MLTPLPSGEQGPVMTDRERVVAQCRGDWNPLGGGMFYIAQTRSMIRSHPDYKHAGKLTCFVAAVVSFALASDAYCGKVKGRRGRSKLAVAIP